MANTIMFAIFAVIIIAAALFSVCTKSIMRAVTSLLFVLFSIAGMYFLLDYTFLGTAQLSIYAGGMTMIYIFAIQLMSKRDLQALTEKINVTRFVIGGLITLAGLITVVAAQLRSDFLVQYSKVEDVEVPMEKIGTALVSAGKDGYILPFEFISIFLLACIIGGLVVSRNQKEDK